MKTLALTRNEVEKFVPHQGTMFLLSGIVSWSEDFHAITCAARTDETSPFFDNETGCVPVWVGFEYMAQTVAALSALERHLRGDSEPRVGYIIGVREFDAADDCLPCGKDMEIIVNQLFRDGQVVSFECRIEVDGKPLAWGKVNAIEPENAEL